jgi:type I restriction enzyme, S subunit
MSWRTLTIGDLVNEGAADIQTGPFGTQLKASDYVNEGTPVINVRNIGFGGLKPEKLEFVTEETSERLASHLLEPRDIVFGRKGAVDRHLYVSDEQAHWIQGSDCIRLRFMTDEVVTRFVSYWFLTDPHQKWMLAQSGNKATMASLNHEIIKRIALRLPAPTVQQATVDILSAYDDLIENNRRRMALLAAAARQLYREWFVRLRFPGHEHTRIIDGVPEGWVREKVVSLLAKIESKNRIPKDDYLAEGPIPCVDQSVDFIGGFTDDETAVYLEPLPVTVFGDHTRALKFVNFPFARGADGTQVIYPNTDRISSEYLYLSLKEIDLSNYFYARHFKFLKEKEVLLPEASLVHEFTAFVRPCFEQIQMLRFQSQKLRAARDLLLPGLMSGEIAV